ncbi:MAG: DUF2752 domain-containing protein [Bacteroidota bacterium]|nr:DUF2752 domain-containing protein [Bacteroidota bacterium]
MKTTTYLIFNILIAGIILVVFAISGIHRPDESKINKKCIHEELLGGKCPVCGMPDGFSAIMRGDFAKASTFQKNSNDIFLFFFSMLLLRLLLVWAILKTDWSVNKLINLDITLSFIVFIFFFKNLALQSIYVFYKMLITGNVV